MKAALPDDIAIFWDYENCPVPANSSGHIITKNIRSLTRSFGGVKVFKAYLETSKQSSTLRSELQSSGVTLVDCPHDGKKEVADKMLLVDMMAYAIDNPAPCSIFVITGDRPNSRPSLTSQTDIYFDWISDVVKSQPGAPNPQAEHKHRQPLQLQRDGVSELPASVVTRSSPCVPVTDNVESGGAEDKPTDIAQFLCNRAGQRASDSTSLSPNHQGKSQDDRRPNHDVFSETSTISLKPVVPPSVPAAHRIATTIKETPTLTPLSSFPPDCQVLVTSSDPANKPAQSAVITSSLPVVGKATAFPSSSGALKECSYMKVQEDVVEPAPAENLAQPSDPETQGIRSFASFLSEDTIIRPATAPPSIGTVTTLIKSEGPDIPPRCELAPLVPVLNDLSAQSRAAVLDTKIPETLEETSGMDKYNEPQIKVKEETHSASSLPEGGSADTGTANSGLSLLAPLSVPSLFTTRTTHCPPKPTPSTPKAQAPKLLATPQVSTTPRAISTSTVNQLKSPVIRKPPSVKVGSSNLVAKKPIPSAWVPLIATLQKHNCVLPRSKIAAKITDDHGHKAFELAGHRKFNSYLQGALDAGYVKMVVGLGQTHEVRLAEPYAS